VTAANAPLSAHAFPPSAGDRAVDHLVRTPAFVWGIGVLMLLAAQLATGTGIEYALLVSLFCLLTGSALQVAGGLRSIPGACILYLAFQHVLVSQVAKAVLGQPADTPLREPLYTMGVYCVGMFSLFCAVSAARKLGLFRLKSLFVTQNDAAWLLTLSLVAIVAAVGRMLLILATGSNDDGSASVGGILGPIKTMELITPFSIAVATAYQIVASGGRKSLGWVNAAAILPLILASILMAGRAAFVSGLVIYVATCAAYGYRFRRKHVVTFCVAAYVAQFIFFPYALYARSFIRTPDPAENLRLAMQLLGDVILHPLEYQENDETASSALSTDRQRLLYYGTPSPTLDRYSVLISVDAIVAATNAKGTTGWETITPGFQMLLPRFLVPDKPVFGTANTLAHRDPGLVGEEDYVTQITLGLFADSFSSFRWAGLLICPFLLFFSYIGLTQRLIGVNFAFNPHALAFVLMMPWGFSEATISNNLLLIFQGALILSVVYGVFHGVVAVLLQRQRNSGQSERANPVAPGRPQGWERVQG
jgi:hypothetical protein